MSQSINPESAVSLVAALRDGESYSRSKFIPAGLVTPNRIRRAQRTLKNGLSSVLDRARERNPGHYTMHGTHSFTKDYDVVVTTVIVRQSNSDDEGEL